MKKLIYLAIASALLASCKKDASIRESATHTYPRQLERTMLSPMPDEPGVYFAYYHGVGIRFENLVYDYISWAGKVDGVPVMADISALNATTGNIVTGDNQVASGGTSFIVYNNPSAFPDVLDAHHDITAYNNALISYFSGSSSTTASAYPLFDDYVNISQYSSNTPKYSGKLVRTTADPGYAIVATNYPIPH